MKRKLSRLFKTMLTRLGLDNYVALMYHRWGYDLLGRLIPDRTYYRSNDVRHVVRNEVKFKLYPADFSQWQIYRSDNVDHVRAAIQILSDQQHGLLLDIGANCGHFSLLMADYIRRNKLSYSILTFEPNPDVFEHLKHNLLENPELKPFIQLENKGVGNESGQLHLQVPLRNSGAGSLVRNYEHEPHRKYCVDIISIDEFLQNDNRLVVFIKIDVENFEYNVLRGAEKLIARDKPAIYLEISGKSGPARTEITELLQMMGYSIFFEKDRKYVPYIESHDSTMDVFALHNSKTKSLSA